MRTKRQIKHLRALYRALILLARRVGYKHESVTGDNGWHKGGYSGTGGKKTIGIGRDQALVDKVIIMAHEVGHALDMIETPVTIKEYLLVIRNWENYRKSTHYYRREKAAWAQAKRLLSNMGGYKAVALRFRQLRTRNLAEYYRQMRKHKNIAAS